MRRGGRLALLSAGLLLLTGASAGTRYGDNLLAEASRHSGGAVLHIDAVGRDGTSIAIGPDVPAGSSVPLMDAMGHAIGTLTIASRLMPQAPAVAAWLARHIYVAGNLGELDPFVPGAMRAPRAQALVEAMLSRYPDLVTLALHVAPPGGDNIIVASSFGRIGKAADKDDLQVERDGAVLREVTNDGRRLAVELPLYDRKGNIIGALSTSFAVLSETDPQLLYARAVAVRDALARRIASRATLFAR